MRLIDADLLIEMLKNAKESEEQRKEDPIERAALDVIYDFAIEAVEEVAELIEKGSEKNGHDRQADPCEGS